ncbi:MAG TPA: carbohydrate kinase family protein [Streptosporangiaceae bacterium]|nr:carbohydrate kinase family protein [Streptosporangiaceae bacterium]
MRIAVTGSIATDHLMTFSGRFTEQLLADKLDKISVSFLVEGLEIRRGGVAANIAFGLGCLGLSPLLVGSVGQDFADYRQWLDGHGVDTSWVRESAVHHTARFVCTTDTDLNQIASFYPGAMSEDADISVEGLLGQADLVLIGAGNPAAMASLTSQCRKHQIPFAADTSQQLAVLGGEEIRHLLSGAAYLFSNEYEASLTEHKTGWSAAEVIAQVGVRVTTLGAQGTRVDRAGHDPVHVSAVAGVTPIDPTGSGDAFRAGFLGAVASGLSLERAAQVGNLMAAQALEVAGPQDYKLVPAELVARCAASYGDAAADEIAAHLG